LEKVPMRGRTPGIFWLRLYQGRKALLAVVTEVPGNPSLGVTNGMSQIIAWLRDTYLRPGDQLVLYEIWPKGCPSPSVERIFLEARHPRWERASRRQIERRLGAPLPALPPHAELYPQVLALGGGNSEEIVQPGFEALPVSQLPPPHSMHKCFYEPRFKEIQKEVQAERPDMDWMDQDLEAGRRFVTGLRAEELPSCDYHQADWKAIADESVRILEEIGPPTPTNTPLQCGVLPYRRPRPSGSVISSRTRSMCAAVSPTLAASTAAAPFGSPAQSAPQS
jgi:hypothetical protein